MDSTEHDVIRVLTWNLERDGGPDTAGQAPQRWHEAHELIGSRRPDLLLRQEMTHSRDNHHQRLHGAERALGMRGFLGTAGLGRHPTGLFVREQAFQVRQHVIHQVHSWRTPPTHVVLRLRDAPGVDIIAISWHLAFNSPRGREREADEILGMANKTNRGAAFIGGGDCNEYPNQQGETVPPVDWDTVTDQLHLTYRTNLDPATGRRTSSTYLDDVLTAGGLCDPARHAARNLPQPQPRALDATAGHEEPGHGGPCRIDRIYLDPWLIDAVLEVTVLNADGLSDRQPVEVVLSRRRMAESLRQTTLRVSMNASSRC
ncbi:endonuclease/exonuclease/phosphatase family protein [Streptomyces nodosus]|uniref:endonuclease/exonuclease/phosphatase family protein n=1 Tax=Streptomyces nodosus TaxID=40318 RepID=UPI003453B4FF